MKRPRSNDSGDADANASRAKRRRVDYEQSRHQFIESTVRCDYCQNPCRGCSHSSALKEAEQQAHINGCMEKFDSWVSTVYSEEIGRLFADSECARYWHRLKRAAFELVFPAKNVNTQLEMNQPHDVQSGGAQSPRSSEMETESEAPVGFGGLSDDGEIGGELNSHVDPPATRQLETLSYMDTYMDYECCVMLNDYSRWIMARRKSSTLVPSLKLRDKFLTDAFLQPDKHLTQKHTRETATGVFRRMRWYLHSTDTEKYPHNDPRRTERLARVNALMRYMTTQDPEYRLACVDASLVCDCFGC